MPDPAITAFEEGSEFEVGSMPWLAHRVAGPHVDVPPNGSPAGQKFVRTQAVKPVHRTTLVERADDKNGRRLHGCTLATLGPRLVEHRFGQQPVALACNSLLVREAGNP